jgi:hypothetical protein
MSFRDIGSIIDKSKEKEVKEGGAQQTSEKAKR